MPRFTLPKGNRRAALAGAAALFAGLDRAVAWTVIIEPAKDGRTLAQNRTLWALYGDIMKAAGNVLAGWSKNELHEHCLGEYFGTEDYMAFGRKHVRPLGRSSTMSKKEFGEYLDWLMAYVAEHGIALADPMAN